MDRDHVLARTALRLQHRFVTVGELSSGTPAS